MKKQMMKMTAAIPAMILMTLSASAFAGQQEWGGQQNGGEQSYSDGPEFDRRVETWCDSVVRDLSETLEHANRMADTDPGRAEAILVSGLQRANNNPYLRKGPLTARAIYRGQNVIQIMKNSVGSENGVDSTLDFTMKYYDFVIDTAKNLDHPHYGGEFRGRDEYETHLTNYIHNEVQFVLDNLAENTGRVVYPKGSTSAFMNELVASIQYASQDLAQSETRDEFSCAAKYLNRLAGEIRSGEFGGEKEAMYEVYTRASSLVSEIQPSCGCFDWN